MFIIKSSNVLKSFLLVTLILGVFVFISCEKDPVDPIPDCEKNNTATITFCNNSSSNSTYDVIFDGVRIGSISPNQSIKRTVASGNHSVLFKYSNTGYAACSIAYPNLATCEKFSLCCSS